MLEDFRISLTHLNENIQYFYVQYIQYQSNISVQNKYGIILIKLFLQKQITKSTRKVTTSGKTVGSGIAGSYTAQNQDHVVCTHLSKSNNLRFLSIRLRSHRLPRVLNSPCCSSLSPNTVHLPATKTSTF